MGPYSLIEFFRHIMYLKNSHHHCLSIFVVSALCHSFSVSIFYYVCIIPHFVLDRIFLMIDGLYRKFLYSCNFLSGWFHFGNEVYLLYLLLLSALNSKVYNGRNLHYKTSSINEGSPITAFSKNSFSKPNFFEFPENLK